jgi:hypothetical protein
MPDEYDILRLHPVSSQGRPQNAVILTDPAIRSQDYSK